ncbi:MAG: glycoside hydrolase family 38 C-terminal domain-containing protein, partial [Armatimonadaceae bacterium]
RYFDAIKGYEFPEIEGDRNPVFQGCFSARIKIKQWNRRMEVLLADAEWADAVATRLGKASVLGRIDEAWEPVLFNQFHDIICGSQVDKVYTAVQNRYERAHELVSPVRDQSFEQIAQSADTTGDGIPFVVFNTLGWDRDDTVEVAIGYSTQDVFEVDVVDDQGNRMASDLLACERYGNGAIKRATVLFVAKGVPASGFAVFRVVPASGEPEASTLSSNQPRFLMLDNHIAVIENETVRVELDSWNGAIRSLVHKPTGWEAVDPNRPYAGTVVRELDNGNFWEYNGHCKGDALTPMLRLHPLPHEGDTRAAFSHHYGGDGRVVAGKARIEFRIDFAFGSGYIRHRVRLLAGLGRVEIQTHLINEEERVRYRMAFPTTVHQGSVVQEIPFGAIERPEGEMPAQHWMDYSNGANGLGILNRGLPGNGVEGDVAMVALLKCTSLKEGYGEIGGFNRSTKTTDGYEKGVEHRFDVALVPHEGDWRDAELVRRGAEYNRPLVAVKVAARAGTLGTRGRFLDVDVPNVVLSAVRTSDDGLVVRVYEAHGKPVNGAVLRTLWEIESAEDVDLIERPIAGTAPVERGDDGSSVRFDLTPWQIRTFHLRFGA